MSLWPVVVSVAVPRTRPTQPWGRGICSTLCPRLHVPLLNKDSLPSSNRFFSHVLESFRESETYAVSTTICCLVGVNMSFSFDGQTSNKHYVWPDAKNGKSGLDLNTYNIRLAIKVPDLTIFFKVNSFDFNKNTHPYDKPTVHTT